MCLHSISANEMIGFKYFSREKKDGPPLLTNYKNKTGYTVAKTDRWLTSEDVELSSEWDSSVTYRSGFHICLSPLDYVKYHGCQWKFDTSTINQIGISRLHDSDGDCWRVRYKDIVCSGIQFGSCVIVAKKIKLDKIVNHCFNNFYFGTNMSHFYK